MFMAFFIQTEINITVKWVVSMVICAYCALFRKYCLIQYHKYILLCFMLKVLKCLLIYVDFQTKSSYSFITPIVIRGKILLSEFLDISPKQVINEWCFQNARNETHSTEYLKSGPRIWKTVGLLRNRIDWY